MFSQIKKLKFIFVITIILSLSGCATTPNRVKSIGNHPIPQNKGVFVLLVNSSQDSINYDTLTLVKEPSPGESAYANNEYSVKATQLPGGTNVQMFTGILDPGKYSLREFSLNSSNARYWMRFNEKNKHSFVIKPDTISDLGRMVRTIKSGNAWAGTVIAFLAPNETDVINYIDMAMPEIASNLHSSHPQIIKGWRDTTDQGRKIWLAIAKMTASGFNHPIKSSSGAILAGTRMGQVLQRSSTGHWKIIDTQSNHTVQAVAEMPNNEIFVGAEMNSYFTINKHKEVTPFPAEGLPFGRVVYAHYFDGLGFIIAIINERGINIYSKGTYVEPKWTLVDVIENSYSLWGGKSQLKVVGSDNRIFFSRDDDLFIYHVASKEWESVDLPFTVLDMTIFDDKVVAKGRSMLSVKSFISEDFGKTWAETNTRSSDSMMQILPGGNAYVLSNDTGGMVKFSSDFGETWYEFSKLNGREGFFQTPSNISIFPLDNEKLMLIDNVSTGAGSSVIGVYDTSSKRVWIERHITVPNVLNYIENRKNNN